MLRFIKRPPLRFHAHVGVQRQHGAGDVPGDAHDDLVAGAGLSKLRPQRVPVVVPSPDYIRLGAHLRTSGRERADRTGGIVRLALSGGEDVPIRLAFTESLGVPRSVHLKLSRHGFVQAGSAARLPASVFDLPTVSVFFSRRSICCQRSWRSSLSRSPQFRSRTSAGFCCAASWPPPTCAPSSACARDPAKAAYSASTTFPDASSRGSVRPGLHRAGAAIALRR